MTTAFSTKSNQNIEDPLYRLLFSDEDDVKIEDKTPSKSTKQIEEKSSPIKPKVEKIKQEKPIIKKDNPVEQKIEETKEAIQDEPEKETIEFNPIVIKPETDLDVNNKSSILEHLVYNLNKLKIPHKIKTFGYHNKEDEFITTEYTIIDDNSKNTILIVHLTKKQVRYQVPSHQKENKKLSKFAKDFQKQLKFTWLEWF